MFNCKMLITIVLTGIVGRLTLTEAHLRGSFIEKKETAAATATIVHSIKVINKPTISDTKSALSLNAKRAKKFESKQATPEAYGSPEQSEDAPETTTENVIKTEKPTLIDNNLATRSVAKLTTTSTNNVLKSNSTSQYGTQNNTSHFNSHNDDGPDPVQDDMSDFFAEGVQVFRQQINATHVAYTFALPHGTSPYNLKMFLSQNISYEPTGMIVITVAEVGCSYQGTRVVFPDKFLKFGKPSSGYKEYRCNDGITVIGPYPYESLCKSSNDLMINNLTAYIGHTLVDECTIFNARGGQTPWGMDYSMRLKGAWAYLIHVHPNGTEQVLMRHFFATTDDYTFYITLPTDVPTSGPTGAPTIAYMTGSPSLKPTFNPSFRPTFGPHLN